MVDFRPQASRPDRRIRSRCLDRAIDVIGRFAVLTEDRCSREDLLPLAVPLCFCRPPPESDRHRQASLTPSILRRLTGRSNCYARGRPGHN